MEQMMEHMVAILEAFEAKLMARLDSLVSRVNAHQAKTEANHEELMAIMKASQERVRRPDGFHPEQMNARLGVTEGRNREKPKLRTAWKK
jgi:thiamine biosynthesis lipoprotein ApbE